jgi:hypothetical protein
MTKAVAVAVVVLCLAVPISPLAQEGTKIGAVTTSNKVGVTRTILFGQTGTDESASFTVTNLKTNVVAFAYSVDKKASARGKQSSAEAFAKHLGEKISKKQ